MPARDATQQTLSLGLRDAAAPLPRMLRRLLSFHIETQEKGVCVCALLRIRLVRFHASAGFRVTPFLVVFKFVSEDCRTIGGDLRVRLQEKN